MSAIIGRDVVLTWGGVIVAAGKTTTLNMNNTPVDLTSNSSSGWRQSHDESGQQNVDFGMSGILVDSTLIAASINDNTTEAATMAFPEALDDNTSTGPIIGGTFKMVSFSVSGETEAGVTFDASFQSSGAVTYTPGTDA